MPEQLLNCFIGAAFEQAGKKTVYLDSVRYNFIPEANARLAALQTKKSDTIGDLTLDLAKRLDGNAELSTLKTFPYCQQYFVVHSSNGLTANPLIRQAIREVVNVDDITGRYRHPVAAQPLDAVSRRAPITPARWRRNISTRRTRRKPRSC